jgi:hypothetical protein
MYLEEEKDFKVESSSLKEIRSFAREVISKSTVLSACSDFTEYLSYVIEMFLKLQED